MIICFDIGGSGIKIAHAYSIDDVRFMGRIKTPGTDFDAFTSALRYAVNEAETAPSRLAISIAGVADAKTGKSRVANIPCLNGRVIHRDLQDMFGIPVDLANDADCFALAEATVGSGRGYDIVLGLILGTGIGGGLVVRGDLINATGGIAGEWGHGPVTQRLVGNPPVKLPAFPCGCGLSGCLDTVCGARGLEMLHGYLYPGVSKTSHEIVDGWLIERAEESRTVTIWLELLAGPLSMLQNFIGAEIIAVGGGLANSHELIGALDQQVRALTLNRIDTPLIIPAECQVEPGLIGAAILGFRKILSS